MDFKEESKMDTIKIPIYCDSVMRIIFFLSKTTNCREIKMWKTKISTFTEGKSNRN